MFYETDKYLKYIDENNLRDTYVQFDTTKYLDKCPGCGIFFNEKIVHTASGKTVHEKCLSGAISSPCYNEAVKIKLENKEHGNVPTQTLEEGLFMN